MATQKVRFQLRSDTAAAWATLNPILANGEPGFEKDTGLMRIGDGVTPFTSLVAYARVNAVPPLARQIATDNAAGTDGGGDLSANRTIRLFGQARRLHELAVNGFVTRVDATTLAGRSIAGTTNQVQVTNPAGAAGNPTISLVFPDQATAEAGTDAVSPTNTLRVSQQISARRGYGAPITLSGASVLFTAIPAAVSVLHLHFRQATLSALGDELVRLGTSGGIVTTGYQSDSAIGTNPQGSTTGMIVRNGSSPQIKNGVMTFRRRGATNEWAQVHTLGAEGNNSVSGGGRVTLSGQLTQLEITRTGAGNLSGTVVVEWEI